MQFLACARNTRGRVDSQVDLCTCLFVHQGGHPAPTRETLMKRSEEIAHWLVWYLDPQPKALQTRPAGLVEHTTLISEITPEVQKGPHACNTFN